MENQNIEKSSEPNELNKMIDEEMEGQRYALAQIEHWRLEYKRHCERLGLLYKIDLQ